MTDAAEQTVTLIDPEGSPAQVPLANAEKALSLGFRKPSDTEIAGEIGEREMGGIGSQVASGYAGLLRGFTLGLSDIAMPADAAALQAQRQVNPGAATTGEIAGMLGGAISGVGPAGMVSKLGAATTGAVGRATTGLAAKGLLGRMTSTGLSQAVGGAVEGSIYGAAQAIDESVLGDTELTAEKVMGHVGWGALIGGGAGGVLGAGVEAGGTAAKAIADAAAKKIGSGGVKKWLEDFAGERALKATLGQQKRAFEVLESKGRREAAQEYLLNKIGVKAGDTTESIAAKLNARADDLGAQLEDVVGLVDEATAGQPLKRLSPLQVAKRVEEEVEAPLRKIAANRAEAEMVEREVAAIRELGNKGMPVADAAKQRAAIQSKINYDKINGLEASADARNKIARIWNDVIDEHVDRVLPEIGFPPESASAYRDLRREFSLVKDLADYGNKRALGNEALRVLSPSDYGTGAAVGILTGGGSTLAGLVKGAGAALIHKVVRERGSAAASALALKASRLKIFQTAAVDLDKKIVAAVSRAMSGTRSVAAAVPMPATKILTPMPKAADRRERYKYEVADLRRMASDPAGTAKRIAASLEHAQDDAPNTSGVLAAKAARGAQFLLSRAPQNPTPSVSPFAKIRDAWVPSDTETAKWARYRRAVEDPTTVIEDLADGRVTSEGVEVLREVYPKLYAEVQQRLIRKMADATDLPPYETRLQLGILFQVPLDPTMSPEFIATIQANHQQAQAQQQSAPRRSEPGPSKMADALKPHSQSILER